MKIKALKIGNFLLTAGCLVWLILAVFFKDSDNGWLLPLGQSKTWEIQNNIIDCGEFIGMLPAQSLYMYDVRRQFGEPRRILYTNSRRPNTGIGKIYFQVNIYHDIAFVECSTAELDAVVLILIRQPGRGVNNK